MHLPIEPLRVLFRDSVIVVVTVEADPLSHFWKLYPVRTDGKSHLFWK